MPLWAWVCFVLLIDVAHVYATLFRTYLNKATFERNRFLLVVIPLLCWVVGSALYSMGELCFWRVLAYLAVFHFIRQQYGFMMLYSRNDPEQFARFRVLDMSAIYCATLYPLLFWHTNLPRNFDWFVSGDFAGPIPAFVSQTGLAIYAVIAVLYIAKEFALARLTGFVNLPRNLILVGTAVSWWTGIVALNSDLAFTITNVVSHGIPYMALIWLFHHKESQTDKTTVDRSRLDAARRALLSNVVAFVAFLALLAYLEEGFWDGFIWREHLAIFAPFAHLPVLSDVPLLALIVPFLALPQSTHYVLDGFIWRIKDKSGGWSITR